jgi:hypothetical protein
VVKFTGRALHSKSKVELEREVRLKATLAAEEKEVLIGALNKMRR